MKQKLGKPVPAGQNWKPQVRNTSRKVVGATSSKGFSRLRICLNFTVEGLGNEVSSGVQGQSPGRGFGGRSISEGQDVFFSAHRGFVEDLFVFQFGLWPYFVQWPGMHFTLVTRVVKVTYFTYPTKSISYPFRFSFLLHMHVVFCIWSSLRALRSF